MTLRWQAQDPWAHIRLMVDSVYDSRAYRFRNDDGSEAGATWKAAQNTPISQESGQVFRLRTEIQETAGGSANNQTLVLQFNINGTGWVTVGAATAVRLAASATVANGTATTNQLTAGTGSFLPGVMQTTANGSNISFAGNDHTEMEWCLLLHSPSLTNGDTIAFRTTVNGVVTATLTAEPSLTAIVPVPVTPENSAHAHVVSSPSLFQEHTVAPGGAVHVHETVSPAVAIVRSTQPDSAAHATAVGGAQLFRAFDWAEMEGTWAEAEGTWAEQYTEPPPALDPANAAHLQAASSPTLEAFQADEVFPDDAVHVTTVSSPSLLKTVALVPADAAHAVASGSPSLALETQLQPESASHVVSSGDVPVVRTQALAPGSAAHATAAARPTLLQEHLLAPAAAAHLSVVGEPTLLQEHTLGVDGAAHVHVASVPALAFTFTFPSDLTVVPVSPTELEASWLPVGNVTGYDLERGGVTILKDYNPALVDGRVVYLDSDLDPDTLYTYRVLSVQAGA